jgi:hypothetical protein
MTGAFACKAQAVRSIPIWPGTRNWRARASHHRLRFRELSGAAEVRQ